MSPLAADILAALDAALGSGPRPRVSALHLPPHPWRGDKDGEFGALALDSGALGLSYLLLNDDLARLATGQGQEGLIGADAMAVARWWVEREGAARTVGFAAVNALSRHLMDRLGWVPPAATDSIAGLAPAAGEHIGMVGYFPPLLKQVTANGARLTVLELRADLVGESDGVSVTLDPAALASCDKLLSTSTVLLNHTAEAVLAAAPRAREIALIGPGAGCWPTPLFQRGVTVLGGTWIVDAAGFVQALTQGQPWSAHARKFMLRATDWQAALAGRTMPA